MPTPWEEAQGMKAVIPPWEEAQSKVKPAPWEEAQGINLLQAQIGTIIPQQVTEAPQGQIVNNQKITQRPSLIQSQMGMVIPQQETEVPREKLVTPTYPVNIPKTVKHGVKTGLAGTADFIKSYSPEGSPITLKDGTKVEDINPIHEIAKEAKDYYTPSQQETEALNTIERMLSGAVSMGVQLPQFLGASKIAQPLGAGTSKLLEQLPVTKITSIANKLFPSIVRDSATFVMATGKPEEARAGAAFGAAVGAFKTPLAKALAAMSAGGGMTYLDTGDVKAAAETAGSLGLFSVFQHYADKTIRGQSTKKQAEFRDTKAGLKKQGLSETEATIIAFDKAIPETEQPTIKEIKPSLGKESMFGTTLPNGARIVAGSKEAVLQAMKGYGEQQAINKDQLINAMDKKIKGENITTEEQGLIDRYLQENPYKPHIEQSNTKEGVINKLNEMVNRGVSKQEAYSKLTPSEKDLISQTPPEVIKQQAKLLTAEEFYAKYPTEASRNLAKSLKHYENYLKGKDEVELVESSYNPEKAEADRKAQIELKKKQKFEEKHGTFEELEAKEEAAIKKLREAQKGQLSIEEHPMVQRVTPTEEIESTGSKLAVRTEAATIEKGLTKQPFGELAGYEKIPNFMKNQAERAIEIMNNDWDSAIKMAKGEIQPPDGTLPVTMYKAVEGRAILNGDFETLYKLGTESTIPERQSLLGREIKAADIKMSDSPLDAMQEVKKARAAIIEKTTGKKPNAVKQSEEIARLTKELEDTKEALARKEHEIAIREILTPQPEKNVRYGSKNKIVSESEYKKTRDELRKQLSSQLNVGVDPTIMVKLGKIGIYHLEAGAREFKIWSSRIIQDVGTWVKPHLDGLWESTRETIHNATIESLLGKISKSLESGKDFSEIGVYVQQLAKQFVVNGVKDRSSLVQSVHNVLKEQIPEITLRETSDAISGYGKYKLLSKDEISKQLRDIKGQLQQISKLEDLQKGQLPLKTGIERRIPSNEEKRLIQQVNEAKKKYGVSTTGIDAIKTRLKNETIKLTDKLNNLVFSPKRKEAIPLDAETKKLKEAYDTAKRNYQNAVEASGMVSREEARNIVDLSKIVAEKKQGFNETTGEWSTPQDKADYGAAKVVYNNYVDSLKTPHLTLRQMARNKIKEFGVNYRDNKVRSIVSLAKDTINTISDVSISFLASVDNSFLGRQGLNTLMTHPRVWGYAAKKSFSDIYKTLVSKQGSQLVKDAVMADVYSRPNYMNGNYDLAKLIPKHEEQFPISLPERLPAVGRVFKASENAFVNSAIRIRLNTFDLIQKTAEKNGVATADKVLIQDIGKLVNSVTARGDLGRLGQGGVIRLILWAPKMLKGNWDVLTAHTGGAGLETPFARQQARVNLLKIVATTTAVAAVVNALKQDSVETNPLSSDFLKIKIGDTRFDITGGKGSLVTLLARAITFRTKHPETKLITNINSGKYGSKTMFDVGIDFLVNKTTPLTRAAIDVARGRDFQGQKPTVLGEVYGLTTPISIQNFVRNFYGEDADGSIAAIVGSVVDLVGINSNTYRGGLGIEGLKDAIREAALRGDKERVQELRSQLRKIITENRDYIIEQKQKKAQEKKENINKLRNQ